MGAGQLNMVIGISSSISDIMTGIILFFIIGCEFFLQYKIVKTKRVKEVNS
jgi:simple sugar transport system permease protein